MSQNELDGKCQEFLDDLFAGLEGYGVGLAVELQKAEADLYGFRVAQAQRLVDFIRGLPTQPPAPVNVRIAEVVDAMIDDSRRLDAARLAPKKVPTWFEHVSPPGNPGPEPQIDVSKLPSLPPPNDRTPFHVEAYNAAWHAANNALAPARDEWADKHDAWTKADNMARLVQWRLAYADALLAALNPQPATVEAQP